MLIPESEPQIDIAKLRWRSRPLRDLTKPAKNHDIIGWDTETYKGYARLICNSQGKYLLIEKQEVCDATFTQILRFLTRKTWRGTHGFFWNIDYDFFAIIKYAGEEFARTLYENGEAEFEKWKISYIPKKAFSITENKHTYDFFDLYQFYNTSLDKAGEKYIGERKLTELIDRTQLNDNFALWKEKER
ncbi:MAG: hypothetical protein J7J91_05805, partial [Deltaproteobacteria bacterium]|nr:hypothetical protein [Deltaproteobacteria bacterium]